MSNLFDEYPFYIGEFCFDFGIKRIDNFFYPPCLQFVFKVEADIGQNEFGAHVQGQYFVDLFDIFQIIGEFLNGINGLLVCAFAGRELTLEAYAQAVREGYRFYSYGDAMLIV